MGVATPCLVEPLVLEHVNETDPSVGANLAIRDLVCFQQPDQIRAGDVQELCRLLGSYFSVNGDNCHSVALGEFIEKVNEQLERGGGDVHARVRSVVGTEDNPSGGCWVLAQVCGQLRNGVGRTGGGLVVRDL